MPRESRRAVQGDIFMVTIMLKIKMPHRKATLVDDIDADLASYKWSVANTGYAQSNIGNRTVVHLHRLIGKRILDREFEKGEVVDHINRNKLDNRRSNLRITNQSVNIFNRRPQSNNTSGVSGVYLATKTYRILGVTYIYKKWVARIKVKNKSIFIGQFKESEFEKAKQARIDAEIKYFGFRVTE